MDNSPRLSTTEIVDATMNPYLQKQAKSDLFEEAFPLWARKTFIWQAFDSFQKSGRSAIRDTLWYQNLEMALGLPLVSQSSDAMCTQLFNSVCSYLSVATVYSVLSLRAVKLASHHVLGFLVKGWFWMPFCESVRPFRRFFLALASHFYKNKQVSD